MGEESSNSNSYDVRQQTPIACTGNTRSLADVKFCQVQEPDYSFRKSSVSACHDRMPMTRDGVLGNSIRTQIGRSN